MTFAETIAFAAFHLECNKFGTAEVFHDFCFNLCTSCFKLLCNIVSCFLRNCFLNCLRSALNEVLSFLKTKACDLTNNLDNVKLACTSSLKNNVKFCLLLNWSSSCSNSNACNRSSRYAEFLFNCLYKVSKLEDCECFDFFKPRTVMNVA